MSSSISWGLIMLRPMLRTKHRRIPCSRRIDIAPDRSRREQSARLENSLPFRADQEFQKIARRDWLRTLFHNAAGLPDGIMPLRGEQDSTILQQCPRRDDGVGIARFRELERLADVFAVHDFRLDPLP